jgi:acyl-CoA synthetase (NDP forming)
MTTKTADPDTTKTISYQELESLFQPRSIAVAGASANERNRGHGFVKDLIDFGFPGPIYPVNPKLDEMLGLKAYHRLEDIPGPVDFVISAVPASAILELVEGARVKGVKLLHLFTARFSETGRPEEAELERELERRIRKAGIRLIGPNCMGLYSPKQKITFGADMPREPGNIGFLSQSGSHAFRVLKRGGARGLRFSKVVSYGNALDLNEADFLDYFAEDPDTDIIAAYIEGVKEGRRFFGALRRAAARKPVVVLKGGRSAEGHAAASSHTAALASQMAVWEAAVRQAGALEVHTVNDMLDLLVAFRNAGPARGNRVGVLGGAGGGMVEAADLCAEAGLELPPLSDDMREALREKLPHAWDWISNPVDISITGGGHSDTFLLLEMMAASPDFDAIIANVSGIEWALSRGDEKMFREMLDRAKMLGKKSGKATMLVMGEPETSDTSIMVAVLEARDELAAAGVAVYSDIERATKTMGRYVRHKREERKRAF